MEHYRDSLADVSDADLLHIQEQHQKVATSCADKEAPWWQRFIGIDRYDWNDPSFLKRNKGRYAFLPIPLTQGFFMIVPKRAHKKMTRYSDGKKKNWRVKIDRSENGEIIKIYARRPGRKYEGEPGTVYAHRELLGVLDGSGDVDHVNGWSLDNRGDAKHSVNLDYVSTSMNGSNALRTRISNHGLPRGVEMRGVNKQGQPRYRGIRCKRLGPHRVQVVRSKRYWLSPEPAAQWYQNQLKKIHKRTSWAHDPLTVNYPLFPPLKKAVEIVEVVSVGSFVPISTSVDDIAATF